MIQIPKSDLARPFPWRPTFNRCQHAVEEMKPLYVSPCLAAGIIIRNSFGSPFFGCCQDKSYEQQKQLLEKNTGVPMSLLWQRFAPQFANRAGGQFPRFRFVPGLWNTVQHVQRETYDNVDFAVQACVWGLAQMPLNNMHLNRDRQYRQDFWKAFINDPAMQVKCLIAYFDALMAENNASEEHCLELFAAATFQEHPSGWAKMTKGAIDHIRRWRAEELAKS